MFTNQLRAKLTTLFFMLAFAMSTLPARADFGFSLRVAVGPAPATPTPQPDDAGYKEPCGDKKLQWLVYGAQIFNAFVVSNAVRQGSKGVTIFGSAKTVTPYIGEMAAEDFISRDVTAHWSCRERSIIQGIIGGSALENAGHTEFPH
jgi:hypothetical protein